MKSSVIIFPGSNCDRDMDVALKKFGFKNKMVWHNDKAIQQTLNGMSFENVSEVRQGKYFDIEVKESDESKAKTQVEDMCKKLLANLVIEDFKIL